MGMDDASNNDEGTHAVRLQLLLIHLIRAAGMCHALPMFYCICFMPGIVPA